MLDRWLSAFFEDGAFLVRMPTGRLVSINGATEEDARLIVHVRTHEALGRIIRKPALCAGEAYMDGDLVIERGALYDFLAIATRNMRLRGRRAGIAARKAQCARGCAP